MCFNLLLQFGHTLPDVFLYAIKAETGLIAYNVQQLIHLTRCLV